ncbi:transposase [Pyxidicoccus caerfyrddinensis]|uniref:transposase n=1 Tax=Pyxidicoccus caerfyrddinensis TaxID=2709663 RepID=UPI0013DD2DFB|nr:transposase [Pyxidicoccus caerfyrddinensis]
MALAAAQATLPQYSSKFSRHDGCTLPQLAACLVLRAFWRTSLRGAQAQLEDSRDLQEALHLSQVPDHNALWRAHQALSEQQLTRLKEQTVRLADKARMLPHGLHAKLSADSTGFTSSRTSHSPSHQKPTRYWRARRKRKRAGLRVARAKKQPKKSWHYPKWTVAIDCRTHLILAQMARRGPFPDVQDFAPLALESHTLRPSTLVLADSGFESEDNLKLCEQWLGARAVMRIKQPRHGAQLHTPYRLALLRHLPQALYCQRNASESSFSADKRRFGDLIPARSWAARQRDVLLRGILHNCALLMSA